MNPRSPPTSPFLREARISNRHANICQHTIFHALANGVLYDSPLISILRLAQMEYEEATLRSYDSYLRTTGLY